MADRPQNFHTIVWATDRSPLGDAACGYVRRMCQDNHSSLRIVHVVRAFATSEHERRIAKLKAMTSALRRHGVNASLHVVRGAIGSPAGPVADTARMVNADLIVLAVRGRSSVSGAIGGSVAQRLLAGAPCPVLLLPPASLPVARGRPATAAAAS